MDEELRRRVNELFLSVNQRPAWYSWSLNAARTPTFSITSNCC
jgi:hypothetical protein